MVATEEELDISGAQHKGLHIVQTLRREIVAGLLPPGSRMPTRQELEQRFKASPVTVQKAFEVLVRGEFVQVMGKRTYVAQHPPHLTRYAVVFVTDPRKGPEDNRFAWSLYHQALTMDDAGRRKLPVYVDTAPWHNGAEFTRLCQDVLNHRVAGLIFATTPGFFEGTPVLTEPGIPRVGIANLQQAPQVPVVTADYECMRRRAVQYLASRGRKRVAVLLHSEDSGQPWREAIVAGGLETRPEWEFPIFTRAPQVARPIVQVLLSLPAAQRPDALIVTDDHLVEQVSAGLLSSGLRVGEDVDVVAHSNFPYLSPSMVPLKRLGFSVPAMLDACIASVDAQRAGENPPNQVFLPSLFEEEFAALPTRGPGPDAFRHVQDG